MRAAASKVVAQILSCVLLCKILLKVCDEAVNGATIFDGPCALTYCSTSTTEIIVKNGR